ncbi:MAG: putative 2-dehydropantoate 2-reductase [Muribaculaceae bacterium]
MKYAIIGTGAIGAYYGAKLAYAGNDVHFLLHSDYDFVKAHGLQVDSCDGSFHLDAPQVYRSTTDMPAVDVVIVALKTTNNRRLLPELLQPLLHNDPMVLLIQNGIGVERDVQEMFPEARLAAGLAFICSAKSEPGRVNHQCYGSINIGNYSCRNTGCVAQLIAELNEAGVKAAEVDYHEARWKKALWNMPFNGMTVALGAQTDKILANAATRQLIYDQMLEVIGAAQALGVKGLDRTFADKMIESTLQMTPYSPSMKLDYDFGRPMEIEYIYSHPIAEARAAGFDMPKLAMLEAELRFLDEKNRG